MRVDLGIARNARPTQFSTTPTFTRMFYNTTRFVTYLLHFLKFPD